MSAPLRLTLINPPYRKPVMRRYVASYFAPSFLLPPTDLLYVSAAARKFSDAQTTVLDAVARRWDEPATVTAVAATRPDALFVQLGFATLADDLRFVDAVRQATGKPVAAMGYLATMFPHEILAASTLDAVVRGEPELAFAELLRAWQAGTEPARAAGLVWRRGGEIVEGPPPERIADLDALPLPDHGAVDLHDYHETLLGRPIAAIFTARGCPFGCTFCVRTYGRQLVMRSAESVLREATHLVRDLGVRNLRFMDDTFNVDPARTHAICNGLAELAPLRWTALARLDRLDDETAHAMARSGCRRLFVGIESGSDRLLREYHKGETLAQMRDGIRMIRKAGIEASGFFIVGGPGETDDERAASVAFAIASRLDHVIVTRLQYWPGTEIFAQTPGIETSIVPFRCRPAETVAYDRLLEHERDFYRRFYLRPGYILKHLRYLLVHPRDLATSAIRLAKYLQGRELDDFI